MPSDADFNDPKWETGRGAPLDAARTRAVDPAVLLSGLPRGAQSVVIGVSRDDGSALTNQPAWTFRAKGSRNGVPYFREFQLGPGEQVEIDAAGFGPPMRKGSLTVEIASGPAATGAIVRAYAAPVNRGVDPRNPVEASLIKTYAAAATYEVPDGAVDFIPLGVDAGWTWLGTAEDNSAVSIATGAAALVRNGRPLAPFFTTTVAGLQVLWLIQL